MSGTRAGGKAAALTNKAKHGEDFYVRLGQKGGTAIHTKPRGFAANRELASRVGVIGGRKSRRRKNKEAYSNESY